MPQDPSASDDGPARRPAAPAVQIFSDGRGPPLVILGGGTDGAAGFAPHARVLAEEFRVLRPESLRLEASRRGKPLPPGYSIKLESAALARSLDALGAVGPADVVGHSFGALVAMDFALDHPDRVRTLVLSEPPAFWVVPAKELRGDAEMRAMLEVVPPQACRAARAGGGRRTAR